MYAEFLLRTSISLSLFLRLVTAFKVVSIPPSTNWDGNDGPWSSFTVQVGSPPQAIRVLPSTSGSSIWAVVSEGCTADDPTNCPNLRGEIFHPEDSSSWVEKGIYNLPLASEEPWGLSGNGEFAFDDIILSYAGGGGPQLNQTILAGIASKDFFIGTLGLAPHDVNFTDFDYPVPSLLTAMKAASYIDSMSWAYTVGAYYTPKESYGSLTIGGYDSSRFVPNELSITRGLDISRDLLVGVQSITSGTNELLPNGIVAMIDSTVAQIWLPFEACLRFEEIFGLTWNDDLQLYLVNETLHDSLIAQDPVVTFTIGSTATSREIVNIDMPYGSFDLTASWPLNPNGPSRYFPLRRAENKTQYLLGRAFLQQAYLIVDYDRNNFSVSQALFPDTSVPQSLIAINPPSSASSSHGMSTPTIIAIICAAFGLTVFFAAIAIYVRRRHRSRASGKLENDSQETLGKPELEDSRPLTMNGMQSRSSIQHPIPPHSRGELDGDSYVTFVRAPRPDSAELHGSQSQPHELQGRAEKKFLPEIAGRVVAAELTARGRHEFRQDIYEVP